jgi:hypothetical protein
MAAAAAKRGCTKARAAALQIKSRIVISLFQVISQLGTVFSIPYPPFYNDLVAVFGVFSLDFLEVMPIGCTVALNHDHYLLMRTLTPLAILLASTVYRKRLLASARRKSNAGLECEAKADQLRADQVFTYNFVLFYLLFPSNSANVFATLQCETLDDPNESSFLRADFSVDCKTLFHRVMMIYSYVMILVYPIGIPALYAYLLFIKHGHELRLLRGLEMKRVALQDDADAATELEAARGVVSASKKSIWSRQSRQSVWRSSRASRVHMQDAAVQTKIDRLQKEEDKLRKKLPDYVQKLILGYELRTYYFELIECTRKLAIVCLPVFFQPSGSVSQLVFGLIVCFLTFGAHMLYAPYVEHDDDHLAQLCQCLIFFSLLSSIVLKYDEQTLRDATNIDVILGALTILPLAFAAVLETPLAKFVNAEARAALISKIRQVLAAGFLKLVPKPKPAEVNPTAVGLAISDESVSCDGG